MLVLRRMGVVVVVEEGEVFLGARLCNLVPLRHNPLVENCML